MMHADVYHHVWYYDIPECTVVRRERNPLLLMQQADSKETEWKTIYYSEESFVRAVFPPDRMMIFDKLLRFESLKFSPLT